MSIIEFQFANHRSEMNHVHSDIEVFYVMEGSVRYTVEDKQFLLKKDDFLVVNVDKYHSYVADGEVLSAHMLISYSELSSMMKKTLIFFWCNTAVERTEATDELRRIIKRIIAEQYNEQGQNVIYLRSLYYEMLNILTSDFLLNKEDVHFEEEAHKFDSRKHEIDEYIRMNFDKQISLEDLSKQLYLSYAYLSKFIKRQFGMGFAEYLNSVRLNFATSQLLHSDQSAARIAMESGFASSAAMNKAFREKYDMTPTEYRKKWMNKQNQEEVEVDQNQDIRDQLKRHFDSKTKQSKKERYAAGETVVLGNAPKKLLKKNWNKMINMGTVRDLLESELQNQLIQLKQDLGFTYVRFWDLYDPEFYLDDSDDGYSFDKLDYVIGFLLKNGMKPYIELTNKPKRVMANEVKSIMVRKNENFHDSMETMERFLKRLMVHLVNRYHTEEIESWYFELWCEEPEEVFLHPWEASKYMPVEPYLERFDMVASLMRSYVPMIRIGGAGCSMRYGKESFREVLEKWKQHESLPDFLTAYSYPYTQDSIARQRNQSRNTDLMQEELKAIRDVIEETGFPVKELHVSEWNFSISSRNILNDHCMKGAYLVRNMIDSIDMADMMGYWVGSDLYSAHRTSRKLLNGGGGLFSKSGIRKPAFYAFDFMNHLGKYVRKWGDHYVISDNGAGNWRIVCHNLKNLNHQYGMTKEDEFKLSDQNNLFEDMKRYTIHFELPGKSGEKYMLRVHSLNQAYGSLQDEWIAMASPQDMWREDLQYLDKITVPRMTYQQCIAENGKIAFDITMEPNEITYIHVTYTYS